MPEQQCPLWGKTAKYKHPSYGAGPKCFTCEECAFFVISSQAEKLIDRSPSDRKIKLSEKSKKAEIGTILVIWVETIEKEEIINSHYEKEDKWF